jgi:mono/diheme cytochrome c family protein
MKRLCCGGVLILCLSLLPVSGLLADDAPDVAAIYKKKCAMCHKADGKGYPAMKAPDFTDKEWQKSRTDDQMIEVIAKGKAPMPGFEKQLKAEEIKLLVTDVVRKFVE